MMPPMAPITPPNIPPWAKVKKFSTFRTAGAVSPACTHFACAMPRRIHTPVMTSAGSKVSGWVMAKRSFLRVDFRYCPKGCGFFSIMAQFIVALQNTKNIAISQ